MKRIAILLMALIVITSSCATSQFSSAPGINYDSSFGPVKLYRGKKADKFSKPDNLEYIGTLTLDGQFKGKLYRKAKRDARKKGGDVVVELRVNKYYKNASSYNYGQRTDIGVDGSTSTVYTQQATNGAARYFKLIAKVYKKVKQ